MEFFWFLLTIAGMVACIFLDPSKVLPTFNAAATEAITLTIKMWGVYAIWLGFLEILTTTNLKRKLFKPLRKIIKFLFGDVDEETEGFLCENIAGNFLGVGGISTPSGIKACEKLQGDGAVITAGASMLILLNTSSIQLIPTTVIGLRAASGSASAADIILPCLIAGVLTTAFSITITKLYWKFRNKRLKKKGITIEALNEKLNKKSELSIFNKLFFIHKKNTKNKVINSSKRNNCSKNKILKEQKN